MNQRSPSNGSRYWLSGFPTLVAQWDAANNNDVTPDQLSAGSGRRVWWTCPSGPDHRWLASANNRTTGATGCPFCANRRVSVTNSLAMLFPQIAAELDPDLNGSLQASQLVASTTRVCWWRCPRDARHVWRAVVRNRTYRSTGCPHCRRRRP